MPPRDAGVHAGQHRRDDGARAAAGHGPPHGGLQRLDPGGPRADRDLPRVPAGFQPGRQDPQALRRVLGRAGAGLRRLLQPHDRRRAEVHRGGACFFFVFVVLFCVWEAFFTHPAAAGGRRVGGGVVAPEGLPALAHADHEAPRRALRAQGPLYAGVKHTAQHMLN